MASGIDCMMCVCLSWCGVSFLKRRAALRPVYTKCVVWPPLCHYLCSWQREGRSKCPIFSCSTVFRWFPHRNTEGKTETGSNMTPVYALIIVIQNQISIGWIWTCRENENLYNFWLVFIVPGHILYIQEHVRNSRAVVFIGDAQCPVKRNHHRVINCSCGLTELACRERSRERYVQDISACVREEEIL